jgi:hypothetical protein
MPSTQFDCSIKKIPRYVSFSLLSGCPGEVLLFNVSFSFVYDIIFILSDENSNPDERDKCLYEIRFKKQETNF